MKYVQLLADRFDHVQFEVGTMTRRRAGDCFECDDATAERLVKTGCARLYTDAPAAPVAHDAPAPVKPAAPAAHAGPVRPRMTAPIDEWRFYAEQLGVSTRGLGKREIIGACQKTGR